MTKHECSTKRMRRRLMFTLLPAIMTITLISLAGCEQSLLKSSRAEPTLIGRWQKGTDRTASITLELKRDGTFDLMRHSEPPVESGGKYTVSDGVLTLMDREAADTQCRNVPGVYRYSIVGEVITFQKVSDPCDERSEAMSRPWRRLAGPSRPRK